MRQIFPLSPCLHFAFRTFVGSSLSSITCRLVFPLLSPCTRIRSQHLFLLLLLPRRKKARGRTEDREEKRNDAPDAGATLSFPPFLYGTPKRGEGGGRRPTAHSFRSSREKRGRKGVEREFGDALFLLLPRFFLLRRPPRGKKTRGKNGGDLFFALPQVLLPLCTLDYVPKESPLR